MAQNSSEEKKATGEALSSATATDSIQLSCSQSSQSMDSNQSGEVEKEAVAN